MKFIVSLLVCGLVAVYSEPQNYYNNYQQWPANFFRQGDVADPAQGRFFFGTQTITLATTTVTTTLTSTTSCTTSTAALSACVASGKRRRRSNSGSSLFYNEEENSENIYLPSSKVERAAEPEVQSKETPAVLVPFVVQPGMMARTEPQFRFLVAFTTATTTVTTSTTVISSLTAICSSTTNLQLCGSTGK